MQPLCLNCNKPLPKGVQSSFCSRTCWIQYKDKRGIAMNPEKQATIMIKDSSKNLVSSLKSELEKKDEIIQHQDKLIREYRDSLETRENDIGRLQNKLKNHEALIADLRGQIEELRSQNTLSQASSVPATAEPAIKPSIPASAGPVITPASAAETSGTPSKGARVDGFWVRFRSFFARRFL